MNLLKSNQTTSQFQNAKQNQLSPNQARSAMKMLNLDLHEAESTNRHPSSIFDLKRKDNPIGEFNGGLAVKGFRSVQAPVAFPPEQRHAPLRKEFQVLHVKEKWIEPK